MVTKARLVMNVMKKRIFLVDDHAIVRYGISELISKQADLEVCGEAEGAADALRAVQTLKPDLVITDISLKESSGLDLVRNIKSAAPHAEILVVSIHDDKIYGELALRAGASGYLMKEEAIENVLVAIRRILSGGIFVSERLASFFVQQQLRGASQMASSPFERLSDREKQVFQLLGQWKGTRQIAKELNLSIKTVEYYREQLKAKLNLTSASELVQYAVNAAAQSKA